MIIVFGAADGFGDVFPPAAFILGITTAGLRTRPNRQEGAEQAKHSPIASI